MPEWPLSLTSYGVSLAVSRRSECSMVKRLRHPRIPMTPLLFAHIGDTTHREVAALVVVPLVIEGVQDRVCVCNYVANSRRTFYYLLMQYPTQLPQAVIGSFKKEDAQRIGVTLQTNQRLLPLESRRKPTDSRLKWKLSIKILSRRKAFGKAPA